MSRHVVHLASETAFEGWRAAARALRAAGVSPDGVAWTVKADATPCRAEGEGAFSVPRAFVNLARDAALHRNPERFDLMYRVLWRLGEAPRLMSSGDAEVGRLAALAREVGRAVQQTQAFAAFEPMAAGGGPVAVAVCAPAHRVAERAAPFFVKRFQGAPFALLTPDVCVGWDGRRLVRAPGIETAPCDAPRAAQALRELGLGSLMADGSGGEEPTMPRVRKPEAPDVAERPGPLMPDPSRRAVRGALRGERDGAFGTGAPRSLDEVCAGVDACRRCDLWRCGQGVAGEGPSTARLMLVGEQPGDQEDLAGRPFVGPAGAMLDGALAAAGTPRDAVFVTNAVKHFKHEMRGKRRLHKTPDAGEVRACRWWLDAERRIVTPKVIVALGATAALGVFGRPMAITRARGQALDLPEGVTGLVTWHPAYLLRTPDPAAKAAAYEAFVNDLTLAWGLAQGLSGPGRAP